MSADLALLAITAVWGATFVTVKDALGDADAFTFLTLRFGLGALAAAALAGRSLLSARVWRNGAILGGLVFSGYALQTLGLEHTSPSRSAFLTGLTVLCVPFAARALAWLPPRERVQALGPATFVAIALAAFGTFLLTGADWSGPLSLGDAYTLGCAVMYGWHIAATSRFGRGLPPLALVCVQLLVTAALSGFASLFVERRLNPTPALWGGVAVTGLVASTLAISVQVWAQARVSPVRAAVIYALEPVFAVLFGGVLGRGWPGRLELVGGALVVGAVLVAELFGAQKDPAPDAVPVGDVAAAQGASRS